ncbi:MAG: hypothetical protein ABI183_16820 [Polyangiaceae bacterium]
MRIAMSPKGLILATISILFMSACGSAPPKSAAAEKSSAWFALLVDDTSDWQVKIRPRDLAQDPVFGPVLMRAEREASAAIVQARIGETTLQALEQSDVLVFAVRTAHPLDAVLIVGGAPASTSPDAMVDDRGSPLWRKIDAPSHSIEEYVRATPAPSDQPVVRLVALPGRTWIIAMGGAVDRMARALSAGPAGPYRPDPATDGHDLVDVLAVGELLVPLKNARGELLQPLLGPLTRVSLKVDGGRSPAAHLVLTYRDEVSAIHAEDFLQTLKTVLVAKYPKFQALIEAAAISHQKHDIDLDSAIPGGLVHMLLEAGRGYHQDAKPDAPNAANPSTL